LPPYALSELENVSEFQRALIADGTVTPDEYEQAVLGTQACLDEHGIPHGSPRLLTELAVPLWDYVIGPVPEDEADRMNAVHDECFDEHERAVGAVWYFQERPAQRDIESLQASVLACLREHGIDAADYDTFIATESSLSSADRETAVDCRRAAVGRPTAAP
jgi:hypothetical protein